MSTKGKGDKVVIHNRVPQVTADFWLIKLTGGHHGRDGGRLSQCAARAFCL